MQGEGSGVKRGKGPGGLGAGGWQPKGTCREGKSLILIFNTLFAGVSCILSHLSMKSLIQLFASWGYDKALSLFCKFGVG